MVFYNVNARPYYDPDMALFCFLHYGCCRALARLVHTLVPGLQNVWLKHGWCHADAWSKKYGPIFASARPNYFVRDILTLSGQGFEKLAQTRREDSVLPLNSTPLYLNETKFAMGK